MELNSFNLFNKSHFKSLFKLTLSHFTMRWIAEHHIVNSTHKKKRKIEIKKKFCVYVKSATCVIPVVLLLPSIFWLSAFWLCSLFDLFFHFFFLHCDFIDLCVSFFVILLVAVFDGSQCRSIEIWDWKACAV